jgi:hypothetical protein
MGYLQLANIAAHNKAVVSLWFRIPAASIAAAAADTTSIPFARYIPILLWGRAKTEIEYDETEVNCLTWHSGEEFGTPATQDTTVVGGSSAGDDLGPCYIAVDCTNPGTPHLKVHIQTGTTATIAAYGYVPGPIDAWSVGDEDNPYLGTPADGTGEIVGAGWSGICNGLTDLSYVDAASPACFDLTVGDTILTADEWHHVLLAFDISSGVATHQVDFPDTNPASTDAQTTARATCFVAVDDVNYNGTNNMGNYWVDGGGANDIITEMAYNVAWLSHSEAYFFNLLKDTATYSLSAPTVAAGKVGIPASSDYTGQVYNVEKAELQIYTGVSLDTSDTGNRRAFVTAEGTPELDYSIADALLGTSPKVRLHGTKNWKAGRNTGTGGAFTSIGLIDPFLPDPDITA